MRRAVRLILLVPALMVAARAAHARPRPQSPQRPDHVARCHDYALRYLGPAPDKEHLTEEEEDEAEYMGAKRYVRLCGDLDDDDTRRAREHVAGHEAFAKLVRLLADASKPDSAESTAPETYAAIADAYESRYRGLLKLKGEGGAAAAEALAKRTDEEADFLIDAYARAVAACGAGTGCVQNRAAWEARLDEVYSSRRGGSDVGLAEFVAGALKRPLPLPYLPWWMKLRVTDKR
jgi:hypothetical protein